MQIENFNFKTGHVEVAEDMNKKGIVRLREFQKPFYVFGKTREKIKFLKRNDVVSVIKKNGSDFNWLLFPQKAITTFTADGSQKKYIWLASIETKYNNGFYATIGNKRVFFNTEKEVQEGESVLIEMFENNHPVFIQNCYCVIPNKVYRC